MLAGSYVGDRPLYFPQATNVNQCGTDRDCKVLLTESGVWCPFPTLGVRRDYWCPWLAQNWERTLYVTWRDTKLSVPKWTFTSMQDHTHGQAVDMQSAG